MSPRPIISFLALTLGVSQGASSVFYSASASPSSNPDSGSTDVWATSTTGTNAGFFQGDSGGNGDGNGAGAGSNAWAMFANSGDEASASHTFAGGALSLGQTTSLAFDNGYIDLGKSAGIQLFSGTTLIFQLYFRGGESFYEYFDTGGYDQDTTAGFSDDGGVFSFTLTGDTSYSASFRSADWTGTIDSATSNPIDTIVVFNNSTGSGSSRNVYFNDLSVIPEPSSSLAGILIGAGLIRRRKP